MPRAPDWIPEEFDIVLQNPSLDLGEFGGLIPSRSADSIQIVRNGMHAFHIGMNDSMLSQMMRERLAQGGFHCPVCGNDVGFAQTGPKQNF